MQITIPRLYQQRNGSYSLFLPFLPAHSSTDQEIYLLVLFQFLFIQIWASLDMILAALLLVQCGRYGRINKAKD